MQKTDKSVFYHFGHKMFSSISMIFLRFENEFCEVEYKQGTIVTLKHHKKARWTETIEGTK